MTELHVVVPNDIDDPSAPSGGNAYDRQLCRWLAAAGWSVREHQASGDWPLPAPAHRDALAALLAALPDRALVLLDGLVASPVPEVLAPEAGRLRLVVLVHLPLGDSAERAALSTAVAVVATSEWTRRRLLDLYPQPAARVHAATPGVDPAPLASGSAGEPALLCVAAVTPQKGHDLLTEALATVADRPWSCTCVGALDRDPGFVARLRRRGDDLGLAGRVRYAGPLTGGDLDAAYAAADLLVHASRGETYGMVVTEALARGIPVLATNRGGLPEALGRAGDGSLPGLLVRPEDWVGLAEALRQWLDDAALRGRLSRSARDRRGTLSSWADTAAIVSKILHGVPA